MDDATFQRLVAEQFPTLETMLYLNHAAISPWPRVAAEAAADFARENCERGPMQAGQWLLREGELRRLCARLLNADSGDDIALLKHTSEGICVVANGLDWRHGDNLVTPENEFVSNQLPWDALRAQGVEVRRIPVRHENDPEGALLDAMDARTRVLTVSAVAWDDGFRLDLKRLGEACSARPVLFFVDAIQQLGALPLDVRACQVDALSAGSHKWQLGPEGMAVFYCNPGWRERLQLRQHGWRMLDEPYRFERPDRSPSATARRFEAGSPNIIGQAVLLASLKLLDAIGSERVARRILGNTHSIVEGLHALPGVQVLSDTRPERRSGIVSFSPANHDVAGLRRALSRQQIYGAVRGGKFRVSPHYYQGAKQLDRLFSAVAEFTS
jgi:selenocysteine lyase/cysteine desulfurase